MKCTENDILAPNVHRKQYDRHTAMRPTKKSDREKSKIKYRRTTIGGTQWKYNKTTLKRGRTLTFTAAQSRLMINCVQFSEPFFIFFFQVATAAAESSSAWHFLTEEKIPRYSTGLVAGDEIGLDAAYLVSVVAEQALAVYGAARHKEDGGRKRRPLRLAAERKNSVVVGGGGGRRGRCLAGRRRMRRPSSAGGGPEAVRRLLCDVYADATVADIAGDADLVRFVLGRLHAAAAVSATDFRPPWCRRRRVALGPPLSLFLRQLYDVSHSTCWHLDEWRRRWDRDELRSLGAFARLLCRDDVRPTDALLDAIQKGITVYSRLL